MPMDNNESQTEQASANTPDLDTYAVRDIIGFMNEADKTVAQAVERALPQIEAAIENIVDAMKNGGKLYYIGAGTSGRLGILDASECPPTFGVDSDLVTGVIAGGEQAIQTSIEDAEDDQQAGRQDVAERVTSRDAVVGIAASGTTPYVLGAIEAANAIGAVTAGISCNQNTPLSDVAQSPIALLSGPEILAGSTRLKAGTAEKMVLNMISTTVMIKLGKVYGNLMVNLQATNKKLRKRAVDIVQQAADVDKERAQEVTDIAGGDVRAAILMIKYTIGYDQAIAALQEANGHFREAMHIVEKV